jgi:hypothetical protein
LYPIAATTAIESDLNPLAGLYGDTLATPSPVKPQVRPDDLSEEPILKPGEVLEGRFLIEAHLATGGMGEVYRANHVHLNRPVAR